MSTAASPQSFPSLASLGYVLGALMTCLAGAMLLPAVVAFSTGAAELAAIFAGSALATAFLGGAFMFAMQGPQRAALMRTNLALVVVAWLIVPLLSSLPMAASGHYASYTDVLFEAVSAVTTTGASLLTNLDATPPALLLWRAELQWIGGYASLLMGATILSALGTTGIDVQRTLLPLGDQGPLLSRFLHVGSALFAIYAGATLVGALIIWAGGVRGFDALCLALSAISTGGFDIRHGGLGGHSSLLTIYAVLFLMLAGALSFLTHWNVLRRHEPGYGQDPEVWLLALVALCALALFLGTEIGARGLNEGLTALAAISFDAISLVTTTGYWIGPPPPPSGAFLIGALTLSLIGGASVSTAGGIKLLRLWLCVSQARGEMRRLANPRGIIRIRYGTRSLAPQIILGVWALVVSYAALFAVTALALAAFGIDLLPALAAAGAALSNAGPLLPLLTEGQASYAAFPDPAKWLLMAVMTAGRLEVLALLSLASPAFWGR